jgi:hypothetical protein
MLEEYCVAIKQRKKNLCSEHECTAKARVPTLKCIKHGGGERCKYFECTRSARDKSNYCIAHGGGERCSVLYCIYGARGKTDKCVAHGKGKLCKESGCNEVATGNNSKCFSHIGKKSCSELTCCMWAEEKTNKCIKHAIKTKCTQLGCFEWSERKKNKCIKHKGANRCPNCIDWIDSRPGSHNYDGYCATCFKHMFPDDERSKKKYAHTKEIMVRNEINEHFEGFVHDVPIYTGNCDCSHRRRVDHRKLIGNTMLAIETDEFGHRNYNKKDEEIRYDDLYMIYSGKWIFIRFNPDSNICKTDIADKINKLIETIEECIYRIEREDNDELLEIIKLYC